MFFLFFGLKRRCNYGRGLLILNRLSFNKVSVDVLVFGSFDASRFVQPCFLFLYIFASLIFNVLGGTWLNGLAQSLAHVDFVYGHGLMCLPSRLHLLNSYTRSRGVLLKKTIMPFIMNGYVEISSLLCLEGVYQTRP